MGFSAVCPPGKGKERGEFVGLVQDLFRQGGFLDLVQYLYQLGKREGEGELVCLVSYLPSKNDTLSVTRTFRRASLSLSLSFIAFVRTKSRVAEDNSAWSGGRVCVYHQSCNRSASLSCVLFVACSRRKKKRNNAASKAGCVCINCHHRKQWLRCIL